MAISLTLSASAAAHDVAGFGKYGKGSVFTQVLADDPFTEGQPVDEESRAAAARGPAGPCTAAVAAGMPEGEGHDHQDPAQHTELRCAIEQVATLSLVEELAAEGFREDVVLGEMDIEQDIAGVSVTFPQAGILFFDVSNPAQPRFLSAYRGRECDEQPIDINCGAFTDLSADGQVAYLSVQNLSSIPGGLGAPGTPGIEVVDISDPENPILTQTYTISTGLTGVHTARSHVIPEQGGEGPRAPGEYVFANRNGFGVTIAQVLRPGGVPQIVPVSEIEAPGLHDTFVQEDPLTQRTYLYLADGFDSGFKVFDVTDPNDPEMLGLWDLTPECSDDWYAHTIDVTTKNGKRYVTLPVEIFSGGETDEDEVAEGCNEVVGGANVAGPMWIVDATELDELATPDDDEDAIKQKSEDALITTWTNPAGRAGGNLTFSPHNQQIVGDKIYLSNYHGGVIVLDASSAFDGVPASADSERPREVGFMVPRVDEQRPIVGPTTNPLIPFFTEFPLGRPHVWDMVVYEGHILTQDMSGGFYSLREVAPAEEPETTTPPPPTTTNPPGTTDPPGDRGSTAAPRCTAPSGRLRARRLGGARLGAKRARNRRAFVSFSRRLRGRVDRFCLTDRRHIRVGYATPSLASARGRAFRRRISRRAVFVLTGSRRYSVRGVRPGARLRTLRRRVKRLGRPFVRGPNRWFLVRAKRSRLVFRVRRGRVREVGIANRHLTQGRRLGRRFVRTFK